MTSTIIAAQITATVEMMESATSKYEAAQLLGLESQLFPGFHTHMAAYGKTLVELSLKLVELRAAEAFEAMGMTVGDSLEWVISGMSESQEDLYPEGDVTTALLGCVLEALSDIEDSPQVAVGVCPTQLTLEQVLAEVTSIANEMDAKDDRLACSDGLTLNEAIDAGKAFWGIEKCPEDESWDDRILSKLEQVQRAIDCGSTCVDIDSSSSPSEHYLASLVASISFNFPNITIKVDGDNIDEDDVSELDVTEDMCVSNPNQAAADILAQILDETDFGELDTFKFIIDHDYETQSVHIAADALEVLFPDLIVIVEGDSDLEDGETYSVSGDTVEGTALSIVGDLEELHDMGNMVGLRLTIIAPEEVEVVERVAELLTEHYEHLTVLVGGYPERLSVEELLAPVPAFEGTRYPNDLVKAKCVCESIEHEGLTLEEAVYLANLG